jgi:hypothetical protein
VVFCKGKKPADAPPGCAVERIEQGQKPISRWPSFLVVVDKITDDLDSCLADIAADPASQDIEMAFDASTRF